MMTPTCRGSGVGAAGKANCQSEAMLRTVQERSPCGDAVGCSGGWEVCACCPACCLAPPDTCSVNMYELCVAHVRRCLCSPVAAPRAARSWRSTPSTTSLTASRPCSRWGRRLGRCVRRNAALTSTMEHQAGVAAAASQPSRNLHAIVPVVSHAYSHAHTAQTVSPPLVANTVLTPLPCSLPLLSLPQQEKDEDRARDLSELLYETALITSGFQVDSPKDYASKVFTLMKIALGYDILSEAEAAMEAAQQAQQAAAAAAAPKVEVHAPEVEVQVPRAEAPRAASQPSATPVDAEIVSDDPWKK